MAKITIYKITNPLGEVYIGKTSDYKERVRRYKSTKVERQVKIYNSLITHSPENHTFEILYELPIDTLQKEADNYEIFYIQQYREAGIPSLNLQAGGVAGLHAEESKEKIRKANTGVVFTEERLRRMSESQKGRPSPRKGVALSEETKRKLSESKKGKPMAESVKLQISQTLKGRIFSDETRAKLSAALKGRKKTPEHIAKTRRK